MDWSPKQQLALARIRDWLADPNRKPVFRLFGPGGVGKTALLREAASYAQGRVLYAAFTGRAAHVMRGAGCAEATTVHRLAYCATGRSRARLRELEQRLVEKGAGLSSAARATLQREIVEARKLAAQPAFTINPESPLKGAGLLGLDEVSMLDRTIGRDLESFGCPILALGDPFQLPPVFGAGYFTDAEPDVLLTEIHRQALGNPIIALAQEAREERAPAYGQYGTSAVIRQSDITEELALSVDQIIVGTNTRRRAANAWVRRARGHKSDLPEPGEKIICLRNDHEIGLLNGSQYRVLGIEADGEMRALLDIEPIEGGESLTVESHTHHFLGRESELNGGDRRDAQEFDFGWAITCHKAQGGAFDSVLVIDESHVFREARWRWLYTAISRAVSNITIAR